MDLNKKIAKNFLHSVGRFLFVLTAVVYLVKAESSVYAPAEYVYYSNPDEIELVVPVGHTGISFQPVAPESTPEDNVDLACAQPDFSRTNKLALSHYDSYVLHQLNSLQTTATPLLRIISILHKQITWHQSSDEPPILIS